MRRAIDARARSRAALKVSLVPCVLLCARAHAPRTAEHVLARVCSAHVARPRRPFRPRWSRAGVTSPCEPGWQHAGVTLSCEPCRRAARGGSTSSCPGRMRRRHDAEGGRHSGYLGEARGQGLAVGRKGRERLSKAGRRRARGVSPTRLNAGAAQRSAAARCARARAGTPSSGPSAPPSRARCVRTLPHPPRPRVPLCIAGPRGRR